jgi:fluoroacetyl-CoA thioesterase
MRKSGTTEMPEYRIGARREEVVEVGIDQVIKFLGNEGARVLSTPQMILFMERTCRNLILAMLDAGHDSVGTHVNVWHSAPAPLGSTVTFAAELLSVEDRRAEFRVQAKCGEKTVGEGTHQRVVIDVARFAEKVRNSA